MDRKLAVRWTIGNVSFWGFEALRLSVWGAWRIFGPRTHYVICINSLPLEEAQARVGELPPNVRWYDTRQEDVPSYLADYLDEQMAEGTAWKFAPTRLYPNAYELALDNDCILWKLPPAIRRWLRSDDPLGCVLAEDVWACFGQFAPFCGAEPRNSGIRGYPPGFDVEQLTWNLLQKHPVTLRSELDEQGLQVAVIRRYGHPEVVRVDDVMICSPFPPHRPELGRCGAHFVGLNARQLPWELEGRPAVDYIRAHWGKRRSQLYANVGITPLHEAAA